MLVMKIIQSRIQYKYFHSKTPHNTIRNRLFRQGKKVKQHKVQIPPSLFVFHTLYASMFQIIEDSSSSQIEWKAEVLENVKWADRFTCGRQNNGLSNGWTTKQTEKSDGLKIADIKKPHNSKSYEVEFGGPTVTRTRDQRIMSPLL